MRANSLVAVMALALGLCGAALAQDVPGDPAQSGRAGRGMGTFHGAGGQITAIEGSMITMQSFNGGIAKVKITPTTRLMKDGNEAKLSDFKVGDRVFAAGEQDKDGVWIAQILGQRTGAGGPQRGGMMGGVPVKPEDNGRTYIAGELMKIDGTKLTVKKPDNTEQVIEVDDDTSFHNERRESITLAEVKPGDFVRGQGAMKDGIFVPKVLNVGRPRGSRSGGGMVAPPEGAPQKPNQPATDSGEKK